MALYYVYYAIKKDGTQKVGASMNPNLRKRGCKYQEIIILEEFDCPIKCGDREIALQLKYFGKRDDWKHYAVFRQMVKTRKPADKSFMQTEEFKTKISEITKRTWENHREVMMKTVPRGSNNGLSKLTEEQVKYIRKVYFKCVSRITPIPKDKMSIKQLAAKFNCTSQTIFDIANEKTWKHVK